MKDIKSKLKKLQVLANNTNFEHEKASALKKLNELMKKHGITEADLYDEAVSMYQFKFKGKVEKTLLYQIFWKVLNIQEIQTYFIERQGRKISNMIGLDCTERQKLEIDFLFDFYKKLYLKEEKAFINAFILKHKLYGMSPENDKNDKCKELSKDEVLQIQQLMKGMKTDSPRKRIMAKE